LRGCGRNEDEGIMRNERKKRLWLPIILFLLIVLCVGIFFWKKAADRKASAGTAKAAAVIDVSGEVTVEKTTENKVYDAFIGMQLIRDDRLETGEDSFVALELDERKDIIISENTRITIKELKELNDAEETWLQMETGAVWANIKEKLNPDSSFEIETPTAVMGVRGTKFSVLHEDDTSIVTVIEGRVEAAVNAESIGPDGKRTVKKITQSVESLQQLIINADITTESDLIVRPLTTETLDPFTGGIVKDLIETQPESIEDETREQLDMILKEASITAAHTPGEASASEITPTLTETPESSPALSEENISTEEPPETIGNEPESPAGNDEVPESNAENLLKFNLHEIANWDLNAELDIPEEFPLSAVPVISGGKVIHSELIDKQCTIAVRSPKSFDETHRFYRELLEDSNGFEDIKLTNYYVVNGEKNGYKVEVIGLRDENDIDLNVAVIVVSEK
jgi:hypothetical protein